MTEGDRQASSRIFISYRREDAAGFVRALLTPLREHFGSDRYDEVIAVWYPSLAAFSALATDPAILEARAHRLDGLERAALICCEPGYQAGVLSSELQR